MEAIRKKNISEVHFQHSVWTNMLKFYKDELSLFQERLEEIASKNSGKEVHVSIEQFQNRFKIQRDEIDTLNHLIHVNEDQAVASGKIHIRRVDYEATGEYLALKERIIQFEKLYKELKDDFFRFLCSWM